MRIGDHVKQQKNHICVCWWLMGLVSAWEFAPLSHGGTQLCLVRILIQLMGFTSEQSHLWRTELVFPRVCWGRLLAVPAGRAGGSPR